MWVGVLGMHICGYRGNWYVDKGTLVCGQENPGM